MQISNLRQHPAFADIIADRGWHAWWTESGVPLEEYRAHLDPMLETDGIPAALVAHDDDRYIGSVLIIENDLDERPDYAPWIAALWVEPDFRRQGIAAQLIASSREYAAQRGHDTCYLCATAEKRGYYLKQGFTLLEEDVNGLDVFSISSG
ncbi:GNAT family N-acetyltransferase [Agrobacterium rosae]|uniref:GNAT family N-acetyltransferase n=1 Tax=Agrobacterium rosae TaxID=1972867 RepID=A0AAW9FBR9_9HYPH|nr:GNAT family N-acetyltransferase [Agrobacterium rosae]MDX8303305.1 GNAT family N-acetyltransferase [Agrobacterium rosae]